MNDKRTQDELRKICEKACEILKNTNDGDLLDPSDLKITESAVNGYLNETGLEVFDKLYQRVVIDGNYVRPYLHDIEHLTRDHDGYIYYKGIHVEHYDRDYVYSEDAKNNLLELKRRCEFLERKGIEVSSTSAVWGWGNYADEYGAERVKKLNAVLGKYAFMYSRVEIYNSGREYSYFVCGAVGDLEDIKNHPVTQSMTGRYFDDEYEIKVEPYIYEEKPRDNMKMFGENARKEKIESLLPSCHDYLAKHGKLEELSVKTYKTDFAANYEKTKELNRLLNNPDRSLHYSEVYLWATDGHTQRFYMYGMPALDEIKSHEEYNRMAETHGVKSVHATTFLYGDGEPLKTEELPPIEKTGEILNDIHDYLAKHGLSQEIRWKNYTENLVVNLTKTNSHQNEPESEDESEDEYEP